MENRAPVPEFPDIDAVLCRKKLTPKHTPHYRLIVARLRRLVHQSVMQSEVIEKAHSPCFDTRRVRGWANGSVLAAPAALSHILQR